MTGAPTAVERAKTAATAPAVAMDPVTSWTSSVIPMPSMDMGMRPTKPERTKPFAPGVRNRPRYVRMRTDL